MGPCGTVRRKLASRRGVASNTIWLKKKLESLALGGRARGPGIGPRRWPQYYLAEQKGIVRVRETKNSMIFILSKDASRNVNGEYLFERAYEISKETLIGVTLWYQNHSLGIYI